MSTYAAEPDILAEWSWVGVSERVWNGGGRLVFRRGALTVLPSRTLSLFSTATAVTQTAPVVELYTARLIPPWFNVSMPITDGKSTLLVAVPIFRRDSLRRLLRQAGFETIEHSTWIDRGRASLRS